METIAFCRFGMVPMRAEAAEQSEQVSQLLFAEWVKVIEETENWTRIATLSDDYGGWVDKKSLLVATKEECDTWQKAPKFFIEAPWGMATAFGETYTRKIFFANEIPLPKQSFTVGGTHFQIEIPLQNKPPCRTVRTLLEYAVSYQGTPYLWGGKTRAGIDCSGFIQAIFRHAMLSLPRDAYLQAEKGTAVSSLDYAQAGDVAFFHTKTRKISHVGLLLSPGSIVHASGDVHIDMIDNLGIFHLENNQYTHYLSSIRRFVHTDENGLLSSIIEP